MQALIFDVFGTVVDWRAGVTRAAAAAFAAKGVRADPAAFADAWRGEYQPAMERIRSGGRGYVPLDDLHLENLDATLDRFGLSDRFDAEDRADLNRAWERLPPWPDSVAGLTRLKTRFMLAPCSNGSIALMTRLAKFGGLPWDAILGADVAEDYKPKAQVYLACARALRLDPQDVMMVACHNDDLAAARAAGLPCAYFPRPAEHGVHDRIPPAQAWDVIAEDLEDLADRMGT
ncbi:MAG: haloacid dehalogenase type II [Pseudomonadota bacterium]